MSTYEQVTKLTTSIKDIKEIEQIIKINGVIENIILYIKNNIFSNLRAEYDDGDDEDEEDTNLEIKKILCKEATILLQNLIKIISEFIRIRPEKYLITDITNDWYSSQKMILSDTSEMASHKCANLLQFVPFYD